MRLPRAFRAQIILPCALDHGHGPIGFNVCLVRFDLTLLQFTALFSYSSLLELEWLPFAIISLKQLISLDFYKGSQMALP
jgi:hypothetical protein